MCLPDLDLRRLAAANLYQQLPAAKDRNQFLIRYCSRWPSRVSSCTSRFQAILGWFRQTDVELSIISSCYKAPPAPMQHGWSLAGEKPKLYYKNLHRRRCRFSWWSCAQAWLPSVFYDHEMPHEITPLAIKASPKTSQH